MKIQLMSDLHLESQPDYEFRPAPEAQLLVLAGDIGSYQPGSRLRDDDFGLGRFSPLKGWPVPVLFVPGNHEYDGGEFDAIHARLRETCDRLGITWLEQAVHVVGGVRFVGCTLWTDFDALARQPGEPPADMVRTLKLRHKGLRAANFYLQKMAATRGGRPLLAEEWRELGLQGQQWLRQALAQPFEGSTVAVTHFAPSLLSADPRYGITPGTAGFCNSLDDLLPLARFWLHGHLHCRQDYVAGGCRVLANPLGYARKGEQEGFRWDFTVDVGGCAHAAG